MISTCVFLSGRSNVVLINKNHVSSLIIATFSQTLQLSLSDWIKMFREVSIGNLVKMVKQRNLKKNIEKKKTDIQLRRMNELSEHKNTNIITTWRKQKKRDWIYCDGSDLTFNLNLRGSNELEWRHNFYILSLTHWTIFLLLFYPMYEYIQLHK